MARQSGFTASLLSYTDLNEHDRLVLEPQPKPGETLVLRGWRFRWREYHDLLRLAEPQKFQFLTSMQDYQLCQFLPNWYETISDLTPRTIFGSMMGFVHSLPESLDWGEYFVKDEVRACVQGGLPIVRDRQELMKMKEKMHRVHGEIEGDLCIRQVEDFLPDTELRLFVLRGLVCAPTASSAPAAAIQLTNEVRDRIGAPFYSVDVAQRRGDGVWRVIDLGDGQVSSLKQWTTAEFYRIWQTFN